MSAKTFNVAVIAPGFHSLFLEAMVKMFTACSERAILKFDNLLEREGSLQGSTVELDMEAEFSNLALDIIGLGVFNYDFGSITKESPVIKVHLWFSFFLITQWCWIDWFDAFYVVQVFWFLVISLVASALDFRHWDQWNNWLFYSLWPCNVVSPKLQMDLNFKPLTYALLPVMLVIIIIIFKIFMHIHGYCWQKILIFITAFIVYLSMLMLWTF